MHLHTHTYNTRIFSGLHVSDQTPFRFIGEHNELCDKTIERQLSYYRWKDKRRRKSTENASSNVQEKYALLHTKYNLVNDNIDMTKLEELDAGHRLVL